MDFDPNSTSSTENIFGLPNPKNRGALTLLPVPWEATTSYGRGTVEGPEAILKASCQVDLHHPVFEDFYKKGIFFNPTSTFVKELNQKASAQAQKVIKELENAESISTQAKKNQEEVNQASDSLNQWVYKESKNLLDAGQIVGLVGGDHSTPYGLIKALSEKENFSILHIDAHADLRESYQGFQHSHASIMNNVLKLRNPPKSLVQVGVRDYCDQEAELIRRNQNIFCFFDFNLKKELFNGTQWKTLCQKIVSRLEDKVYISFDIDGLSPELCPNTGTPVPGGLTYDQALCLLFEVFEQGKKLIGFDLVEVAPAKDLTSEWDANVGARILYNLCGLSLCLFKKS